MDTRAYRSKIGRLPFALRNELNERIRDGEVGTKLVAWLNSTKEFKAVQKAEKCEPINAQNLTEWRGAGYKAWLADQDKSAWLRGATDLALMIAQQTGGSAADIGTQIAAGQMVNLLESADEETLPELAKALAKIRSEETKAKKVGLDAEKNTLDRERLNLDTAKYQRETCKLFIEWRKNKQALEIADDRALDSDAKTEALGKLMFGDLWRPTQK